MATLILDAGSLSPISLTVQQAGENAPTEIGTVTPSANGADRSSVRGIKRNFGALTTYLSTVNKDAVLNKLRNGRQIPCSGDLLGNIQTMCTMRYTGARMLPQFADLWEVGLVGNEVQPNNILLKYAPSDTITGEVFARASSGTYYNSGGVVSYAGTNVKRDGHYIGGVRTTLLEGARTNLVIQSSRVDLGFSPRSGTLVASGVTDPHGSADAALFTPANSTSYAATAALGVNINGRTFSVSVWMCVASGTKTVTIGMLKEGDGGCGITTTVVLTTSWQRFTVTGTGNVSSTAFWMYFQSVGDTIPFYLWGAQTEEAPFVSSYIPTTTVAATRASDFYYFPYTVPPQEMSVYMKWVDLAGAPTGTPLYLWGIEDAGSSAPAFLCYNTAVAPKTYHANGVGAVESSGVTPPSNGQTAEVVSRLFGDGSVDTTLSLGGGAAGSSAQTAALALAPAWSGPKAWMNSAGSTSGDAYVGFRAIQSFKIVAGMRSFDEMQAA